MNTTKCVCDFSWKQKKNSEITTKKNAILIDSETYAKIIIIKTNEITEMQKFFFT